MVYVESNSTDEGPVVMKSEIKYILLCEYAHVSLFGSKSALKVLLEKMGQEWSAPIFSKCIFK